MDTTTSTGHPRWWSPALVVHALVVVALVVAEALVGPSTSVALAAVVGIGDLLLGLPWWLLTGFLYVLPLARSQVLDAGASALPLVINLVLHAVLLRAARRRSGRPGAPEASAPPPSGSRRRPGAVLAGAAGLGALLWGAWLGWDHAASYDVVTDSVQSPYVTLQVLGCALTVGLATALLAARWHPVAAAAGVALGFWLPWTVDAAASDDSGLFAVGSVLLALGLALGTALAAAAGRGARWALSSVRARHATRPGAAG